jgi:N-acetylglucosamine-6-phosphate deacetylase
MQGDLVLENAIAYTPQEKLDNAVVAVERGKVRFVGPAGSFKAPESVPTVDLDGGILTPGFIDLQHNGAFGFDFTENPERIWDVAAGLTRYGVTGFLPTIITSPLETIAHAQEVLREGPPKGFLGATPLGLHIEGPFLSPINKGAHDPEYLRLPDREEYWDLRPENSVRMVTLAPELPGAEAVVRMLVDRGVLVSAGHSAATFDEMQMALDWGVRYATHLFNAMAPLHHHHPGLVGALLHDPRATVGIIADLVHLHPAILKMIFKTVPPGRINLVSDAMSAFGMPDGSHRLSNQVVEVHGMVVRHPSGVLAGSVLSLDQAIRNVLAVIGCEFETALPMVTSIPARLLGMQDEIGSLTTGMRGDLVVLDKNLNVRKTIIAGRIVYEA